MLNVKKSVIMQYALDKHLRINKADPSIEKHKFLCFAAQSAFISLFDTRTYFKHPETVDQIRADISTEIDGHVCVESWYLRKHKEIPTAQQATAARIFIAIKLINRYKEQEQCNQPSTKSSNFFNWLKAIWKNKRF